MAIGDSITDGWNIPGGYRIKLWDDLQADHYTVDFVGPFANGPDSLGDKDHAGRPGNRIDQIAYWTPPELVTYKPRTVLLHAGSNDLGTDDGPAAAPGRLSDLIDIIRAGAPDADIFVAQITPQWNPLYESRIEAFNAQIPGIVASKGSKVHLVDMHSALTMDDLADGVHPNAAGYAKMADVWYAALRSVPGSIGAPIGTPVRYTLGATGRCLDVYGANPAPLTKTIIWPCHSDTNQQWTRTAAGELQVFGSSCLDVLHASTAAGSEVGIYPCHGRDNQLWSYRSDGTLYNAGSGRCLAVANGSTAAGTGMVLADCDASSASQRWVLG
jgi:lysophospholipase L1-like esterase